MNLIIPEGYKSLLDLRETQVAIKQVKDYFQKALASQLNLTRVSAPLFVDPKSGLNDNLNGVERPVAFDIKEQGREAEIVHSLAKWKRYALGRYGFKKGEGLYTDMNAIRRDEDTDNLHSLFVDQWDWECVIDPKDRNVDTLKDTVRKIYKALLQTEEYVTSLYPQIERQLSDDITFVTTSELEEKYPSSTPKEREYKAVQEYGSIFLMQIGDVLSSGEPHDGRAPDYDDWSLNGDIIVYYSVLDIAYEISSMGIRVDDKSLKEQLEKAGCPERGELPFQKAISEGSLPLTIGGGIGQSRLCMYFLKKAHIGEVQASMWPDDVTREAREKGLDLL